MDWSWSALDLGSLQNDVDLLPYYKGERAEEIRERLIAAVPELLEDIRSVDRHIQELDDALARSILLAERKLRALKKQLKTEPDKEKKAKLRGELRGLRLGIDLLGEVNRVTEAVVPLEEGALDEEGIAS
jgi:hypothetical protein